MNGFISAQTLNDFLSTLTESEDYQFNLFKYWLHNIIEDWNEKLKVTNLFSENESILTVSWLKYIMNLLADSTNTPKLKEFCKILKQSKKKLFNEYQVCGWNCLGTIGPSEINAILTIN